MNSMSQNNSAIDWQSLTENLSFGIINCRHDLSIQYANPAFYLLSQTSQALCTNQVITNIFPVSDFKNNLPETIETPGGRLQLQLVAQTDAEYWFCSSHVASVHAPDPDLDFRTLFENSNDAIAYFDLEDQCKYANQAFCNLIGYSLSELMELSYRDYTPEGWESVDRQLTEQVQDHGSSDVFEKEYQHKSGDRIAVSVRATGVKDSQGKIHGVWFIFRDISENQQHMRKLVHQQQLLEQTGRLAGVGGWEYAQGGHHVRFTPESLKLLGLPLNYNGELMDTLKLFDEESRYELQASVEVAFMLKSPFDIEVKYLGFKQPRWLRLTGRVRHDGSQQYLVGAIQDISSYRASGVNPTGSAVSENEIRSYHDSLTNLPTQLILNGRLAQALERQDRYRHGLVFIELDLQQFRRINENAGYSQGDQCLITVCNRLKDSIRKKDMLARIGGDEFGILAENCSENKAVQMVNEIIKVLEKPIELENLELKLKICISVVIAGTDNDVADIYRAAEQAIVQCKESNQTMQLVDLRKPVRTDQGPAST